MTHPVENIELNEKNVAKKSQHDSEISERSVVSNTSHSRSNETSVVMENIRPPRRLKRKAPKAPTRNVCELSLGTISDTYENKTEDPSVQYTRKGYVRESITSP